MNKEKQILAIASACGISSIELEVKSAVEYLWGCRHGERIMVPDFLNDLNAMHEAEGVFYDRENTVEGAINMSAFSRYLCHACKYPLRATAAQRAEAFLRTLGKWEESGTAEVAGNTPTNCTPTPACAPETKGGVQ